MPIWNTSIVKEKGFDYPKNQNKQNEPDMKGQNIQPMHKLVFRDNK